jgi:DNA-binding LacI/PurR family transcriptional regulator
MANLASDDDADSITISLEVGNILAAKSRLTIRCAPVAKSEFFPSYRKVAKTIRNRILHGDYALKPIPSERHLALELGVNYMTVRRGLQILEEEGLLFRDANGRKKVKPVEQGTKKHLNFAFIAPALASHALEVWRAAIEKAAEARGCRLRPVLFVHWDDPILKDVLEGFDGIFLVPVAEPVMDSALARLRSGQHRVVVVDHDFSRYGIPSLRLFPPVFIQKMLDHLAERGHSCIGCFNTQPNDQEVFERIGQWRLWMAAHGYSGRMINDGIPPQGDPIEHAYEVMNKLLSASPPPEETAWFFTTAPAALGAMRAMQDRGIQPGRDVAICTANGEGIASMLNPPITALEPVDPIALVTIAVDWMRGGQHWQGPLLLQPSEIPLVIRESTQPGAGRGLRNQSRPVSPLPPASTERPAPTSSVV